MDCENTGSENCGPMSIVRVPSRQNIYFICCMTTSLRVLSRQDDWELRKVIHFQKMRGTVAFK